MSLNKIALGKISVSMPVQPKRRSLLVMNRFVSLCKIVDKSLTKQWERLNLCKHVCRKTSSYQKVNFNYKATYSKCQYWRRFSNDNFGTLCSWIFQRLMSPRSVFFLRKKILIIAECSYYLNSLLARPSVITFLNLSMSLSISVMTIFIFQEVFLEILLKNSHIFWHPFP